MISDYDDDNDLSCYSSVCAFSRRQRGFSHFYKSLFVDGSDVNMTELPVTNGKCVDPMGRCVTWNARQTKDRRTFWNKTEAKHRNSLQQF